LILLKLHRHADQTAQPQTMDYSVHPVISIHYIYSLHCGFKCLWSQFRKLIGYISYCA